MTSNAAVSRRLNGGRSDSGIGPEFRLVAGTVCPGHAYGCPYIPTYLAGMQYYTLTNQQTKVCWYQTNGMVKHLHVTLDDDDYERLREVKDKHGGTWEEWLLDQLET